MFHFVAPGPFRRVPQGADDGHGFPGIQPVKKIPHLVGNDGFRLHHRGLTGFQPRFHHLGQIVHGVEENVVQIPTSGSMSRGTAKSTIKMGRWRRSFTARSTNPRPIRGMGLPVQETTMS